MVEVYFEVPTGKEKLDTSACVDIYFNFIDDINYKIAELEKTQGENHIHNKCQEIDQYLREHKYNHNECYGDNFKRYVRNLEGEANTLLSKSSVYSEYCMSSTSKDEERTKLKGKTVELGKEKGNTVPENLPAERSSQTTAHCTGKPCKGESSENQALSVANPTDTPEPSTGSATITSRLSKGTTVIVDSPSAESTTSELEKERSGTCKEEGCPSEDLQSSGHSTTEGSEARLTMPSSVSGSVKEHNSAFFPQKYVAGLKTIYSKPHNREYTHCEATKDQYKTDGSEDTVIIKLHDCKNENIAYTILENPNNKTQNSLYNSQIMLQPVALLPQSPGREQTLSEKSTFPEKQKFPEPIQTKEDLGYAQPQLSVYGKLNIPESSNLKIISDHQVTVEQSGNVVPHVQDGSKSPLERLRTCDNTNCRKSHLYINEDESSHPNGEYQQNNAFTMNSLGETLNSGNGIVSSGNSMFEATDAPPEEPSLKMYTTIIAMILGGILFFALLSKFTPLGTLFSRKKKKKKKEIEKKLQRILSGEASIEERNVYMPYGQLRY